MTWSKLSRHERGYDYTWTKTRQRILDRDMHLCQVCKAKGRVTPATEVDHVRPKAQGGTDGDDNLQAVDHECHRLKTEAEAAAAQGKTIKPRTTFTPDGRPVWPE